MDYLQRYEDKIYMLFLNSNTEKIEENVPMLLFGTQTQTYIHVQKENRLMDLKRLENFATYKYFFFGKHDKTYNSFL